MDLNETLRQLEKVHEGFRVIVGINGTAEGSLRKGYAICSTCPGPGEGPEGNESGGGGGGGGGGPPPSPPPEEEPTGACCIGEVCSITTASACDSGGGTYFGNGSTCAEVDCTADFTGACCADGTCSIGTEAHCASIHGHYLGNGSSCAGVDCTKGACCNGSTCTVVPRASCTGIYLGDGTICTPNPCPLSACPACAFTGCDGQHYLVRAVFASGTCVFTQTSGHYNNYEFESVLIEVCDGEGISCTCAGNGSKGYDGEPLWFFTPTCGFGESDTFFTQVGECNWLPAGGVQPRPEVCSEFGFPCGTSTCEGSIYDCECQPTPESTTYAYNASGSIMYSNPCVPT